MVAGEVVEVELGVGTYSVPSIIVKSKTGPRYLARYHGSYYYYCGRY